MLAELHTSMYLQTLGTDYLATGGVCLRLKFSAAGNVLPVSFIWKSCDKIACLRAKIQLYLNDCRKMSNGEDVFMTLLFDIGSNIFANSRIYYKVERSCI